MPDLKIPRDRDDDYSAAAIKARQEFVREQHRRARSSTSATTRSTRHPARQHRELLRRRAGADRAGRAGAGQRRARAGGVPRPARDDRGHAGGVVQPRHEAVPRRRRDHHDRARRQDAAGAGLQLRQRAGGEGVRGLARRELRADRGRRAGDDQLGQADRDPAVLGLQAALHAVQLHDRRRGRAEHDRQGDVRRLRLDQAELPGRAALPARGPVRDRQEDLGRQHAAHPRQAGGRRDHAAGRAGRGADARQHRQALRRPACAASSARSCR